MKHIKKFNEGRKSANRENEIKDEIKAFHRKFNIIYHEIFDWKEVSEYILKDWEKTIKKVGGYFYKDPACEGSDTYGVYISLKPMSRKDLNEITRLEDELIDLQ